MTINLDGDALRDAIDDALAEIDRVEEEMLELFAELLGPDAALEIVKYAKAQEEGSRLLGLTRRKPDAPEKER